MPATKPIPPAMTAGLTHVPQSQLNGCSVTAAVMAFTATPATMLTATDRRKSFTLHLCTPAAGIRSRSSKTLVMVALDDPLRSSTELLFHFDPRRGACIGRFRALRHGMEAACGT